MAETVGAEWMQCTCKSRYWVKIFIFFVGNVFVLIFRSSSPFDPKGHYRKVINTVGLSWELG